MAITWEIVKALGPTVTAIIAASVFFYTVRRDKNTKKKDEINKFLGDKEPLAHEALKIILHGFNESGNFFVLTNKSIINKFKRPKEAFEEQIEMVIQGCVFTGSDRARAFLYYIVSKNKDDKRYKKKFREMYELILNVEEELNKYGFSGGKKGELDQSNFTPRISALKKIFDYKPKE